MAQDPDGTGCLLGTYEVIGKDSSDLERIYGCLYVHFQASLDFTRNEQMRCSDASRGNTNGAKYPNNITSHVDFLRNVSGENMTRPGKVKKNVPKTTKIKGYNTRFRTFSGPKLRSPRDAFYDHRRSLERSHVASNESMDAFTFILSQF